MSDAAKSMSDAAKSAHEIEDVLASIRRLVSESGPAAAPAEPALGSSQATTTRLVLTPALRVTDPDDPWAPVPLKGQDRLGGDVAAQDPDEDPAWDPQDRLADWGEIEDSGAEAVADAIAEQSAHAAPLRLQQPDLPVTDALDGLEPLADYEPETGDANWPDRNAGTALRDLALARGQTPRGDATDDGATAPTAPPQDSAATPVRGPVFSRRLAVRRSDAAQPGDASDDDDDDLADDLTDQADLDEDVEDLGEATSPFTFPEPEPEDSLLDEDTLRDIIAEVVRQELQGALGQRITRNVRKMVRREVRLALAAEDLE